MNENTNHRSYSTLNFSTAHFLKIPLSAVQGLLDGTHALCDPHFEYSKDLIEEHDGRKGRAWVK